MGGFGSGRRNGKPIVEGGLVLDLGVLMRRHVRPASVRSGTITWDAPLGDEAVARISYVSVLKEAIGAVWLGYTTHHANGTDTRCERVISLATTPQPFGGRRWWFVCPRSGKRVAKLYLPAGSDAFASRQAHGLAYRSQRETLHDRTFSRAHSLRRRLGADGAIGDLIDKPKGMRWATFDRKLDEVRAAEGACVARSIRFLQDRCGRSSM